MRRLSPLQAASVAMPAPASGENQTTIETEQPEENLVVAETVVAEVSKEGSVVTFKLSTGGNIPSDGAPHKTTIFNDDYPL
jgi:hypothetical protein